jgi:hypothetical protein
VVVALGLAWFLLMAVAAFGAVTGNAMVLFGAVIAGVPLSLALSQRLRR